MSLWFGFSYLSNKRFCWSSTHVSIASIFCGWIGFISDCFILYATSAHEPLKPFNHSATLESVQESDEETQDNFIENTYLSYKDFRQYQYEIHQK